MSAHGRLSSYTHGCRCDRCRASMARYQAARRSKLRVGSVPTYRPPEPRAPRTATAPTMRATVPRLVSRAFPQPQPMPRASATPRRAGVLDATELGYVTVGRYARWSCGHVEQWWGRDFARARSPGGDVSRCPCPECGREGVVGVVGPGHRQDVPRAD